MAEGLSPTKASRAATDTSKVQSAHDVVREEVLGFYNKPLQVEVDVTVLMIDKQKKKGQIQKYRQKLVGKVKRSLMANPPEERVTVTAWHSPGT